MKVDDETRALWEQVRETDRHRRNLEQLTHQISALASRVDDALEFPIDDKEPQFRLPLSEQLTSLVERAKALVSEFEAEGKRVKQQFHETIWRFLAAADDLRKDDRICCSNSKGQEITVIPHNFFVGENGVGDLVFWCTIVRKDGTMGKRDHSFHLVKDRDSWTKKRTQNQTLGVSAETFERRSKDAIVKARVSQAMKDAVKKLAAERGLGGEAESIIIREALNEFFQR